MGTYGISRSWVFRIILITAAVFFLQMMQGSFVQYDFMTYYFGLIPGLVVKKGFIWQIFSYMFLHGSPMHILLNMYGVFMFGAAVEEVWGPKKFLIYYLFCGIGAGISIFVINVVMQGPSFFAPTIGASGAVFGLLLAFGMLFPEAEILLFFILPIRAKYMVVLYGGIELYFELSGGMSSISHVGHLGGLAFGLIYFFVFEKSRWMKKKVRTVVEKIDRPGLTGGKQQREAIQKRISDQEMKKVIIEKLSDSKDFDSLTDDEHQFVKYLDIMTEAVNSNVSYSVNLTDDFISDRQFLGKIQPFRKK